VLHGHESYTQKQEKSQKKHTPEQTDDADEDKSQVWRNECKIDDLRWDKNRPIICAVE
jgi:hypothetical protein